jgi:hypothetical protein
MQHAAPSNGSKFNQNMIYEASEEAEKAGHIESLKQATKFR